MTFPYQATHQGLHGKSEARLGKQILRHSPSSVITSAASWRSFEIDLSKI